MTFHSLDFLVFFLVVTTVYWRLPHRAQNRFLLVASYIFYGWFEPWFCALLAFTTVVDWFAALKMDLDPSVDDEAYAHADASMRRARRRWLVLSLVSNLSVLGFFKYFNFFVGSVQSGLTAVGLPNAPQEARHWGQAFAAAASAFRLRRSGPWLRSCGS